jgi:hypothetical protein
VGRACEEQQMMSSTTAARWAGAGILVATAVVGAVAVPGRGEAASRAHTVHLVAAPTGFDQVDNGSPGASVGDVVVDRFRLRRQGHGYGRGEQYCVLTDRRRHGALCTGSLSLPGGTIVLAGTATRSRVTSLPVVGGTGRYRGTSGLAVFTPHGRSIALDLRLEASR